MTAEDERAKLEARIRKLEHEVSMLARAVAKLIRERGKGDAAR